MLKLLGRRHYPIAVSAAAFRLSAKSCGRLGANSRSRNAKSALFAAAALAVLVPRFANATAYNWTYNPDGSTQNWSTSADWQSSSAPPSGGSTTTVVNFYIGATALPITSAANLIAVNDLGTGSPTPLFTLNSLTLNGKASSTAGANAVVTLSGATLVFDGTSPTVGLNAANSTASLSYVVQNNIQLNQSVAFSATGNALSFTFSGVIGDGGLGNGISKSGGKIVVLSGVNTYGGTTTISGGEINLGVADGGASGSPIGKGGPIVFSGGELQYSAANQTDYSSRFSTAAGQQYNIDTNSQNVGVATALNSSGGSLVKAGLGKLTLSTVNSYSGGTNVYDGTLEAGVAGGLGTGAIAVDPTNGSATQSALLMLDSNGAILGSQSLTLTKFSSATATANLNYSGTDTIFSLIYNGTSEPAGVYGSSASGATNTESWLTGTGTLTVAAPEPGSLCLIGIGVGGLLFRRRRPSRSCVS